MTKTIKFYKNLHISDKTKWFSIGILTTLMFINHYYINLSLPLINVIINLSLASLILRIIFFTKQGKRMFRLIHEAKEEIKIITWPNLKETFYTTVIVIVTAFIISLILWGLDNILVRFISSIISLRI
ncbi:MAG: preprotein translocase subunit SecE [Buchnera aphidicola (Meitanaphis microgallis)]